MGDTITLTGNIATDPRYKVTQNGLPILDFRLVTSERRFDEDTKAWVDGATNWYSVSVYRGLAKHASMSLKKGQRVVVSGRLRLNSWEHEGRQGFSAEVSADAIGHDLLFGTSSFTKATASGPPADTTAGSVAGGEAVDAAWAPPMQAGASEREHVPSPGVLVPDETPF
jgi:single-strand DNA-binding protein